ncbi:MAG: DUF5106 domain-containing protein [Bacteroidales bacterium]|nr:DUF5106 domain-containing protein [Bacteroidales bacterium]
MKKLMLLLLVSAILTGIASAQGYEIKVKIHNIPNDTVILGHHFSVSNRLIPDDTVVLDNKCEGVFRGKEKLPVGMYFIFLPSRNYFDILIDGNQHFSIENDTVPSEFLKNMKITGSIENQRFHDYQVMLGEAQKEYSALNEQLEKVKGNEAKENEIKEKMKTIGPRVEDEYKKQITQYPDHFFSKFLTATREVEVPESITDQTDRFYYYKAHFFDNFPLNYPPLIRTPIYQPKIEKYINNLCMQMPDSLIKETKWLINQTRGNDELFRFMLVFLYNKYAKDENMYAENVYVELAEIYCKDAKWESDSFKTEIKKKITKRENCLVGHPSKDLLMRQLPNDTVRIEALRPFIDKMKDEGVPIEKAKPDFEARRNDVVRILNDLINHFGRTDLSVHSIPAKYKMVVFWEPDCSHCKEEMPKLFSFYKDTLNTIGCKVFAIYMNRSVDNFGDLHRHMNKWFDFVEKQKMFASGWYNLFNPFDQYRDNFDVNSTPTFYLLDSKNEIIAKRISFHQMYELMKYLDEAEEKQTGK